jgi:glycosyltransferase involved in cell wall biosynthesis
MRVYSRLEVGGIEHQMLNLLPRLNRGRFRVSLCLIKRAGEMADWVRERGIDVHVVPFRGRLHPASLRQLARLFRRCGTRIVHAHVRESNTSATVAARMAGVPVVIGSIHNMDTIRGWRRILQDRILDRFRDATVAVSERVRRNYCETVGIDPAKVRVIYNGVDLARFEGRPTDRQAVLGPLGVPPADRIIACVARLVPQKSQETLLAAASRLLVHCPETSLLIVGEGERLDPLREEARQLGVASKVVFTGKRDDIPKLLRCCDISALTSTREGFSNVVLESLAAGLPVVATDVGGNSEAIEEGVSGYLVPVGDVEMLAERLTRLLSNERLLDTMSAAARRRAEVFSLDETVAATERLYGELLEARGVERATTPS